MVTIFHTDFVVNEHKIVFRVIHIGMLIVRVVLTVRVVLDQKPSDSNFQSESPERKQASGAAGTENPTQYRPLGRITLALCVRDIN